MLKKIRLLGTEIDNYTAHEALEQVEAMLEAGRMDTVTTVTTFLLRSAETNELVRRCLERASLTIIGEEEILHAAGLDTTERKNEVRTHFFFREFMKRIERNHKKVFLLTDEEERLQMLTDWLEKNLENGLTIVGTQTMAKVANDWDQAVNEINAQSPDVVLSLIRSPVQEEFLAKNRNRLDVRIWYGIAGKDLAGEEKNSLRVRLRRRIRGFVLKRQAGKHGSSDSPVLVI